MPRHMHRNIHPNRWRVRRSRQLPGGIGNGQHQAHGDGDWGRYDPVCHRLGLVHDANKMLGVYRLVPNTSTNWTQVAASSVQASYENQAWYNMYIAANPSNANDVYFGLSDIYHSTNAAGARSDVDEPNQRLRGRRDWGTPGPARRSIRGHDGFLRQRRRYLAVRWYLDLHGRQWKPSDARVLCWCARHVGCGGLHRRTATPPPASAVPRITAFRRRQEAPPCGQRNVFFGDGGYALIDPVNNNNRYSENADGGIAFSTDGGVQLQ